MRAALAFCLVTLIDSTVVPSRPYLVVPAAHDADAGTDLCRAALSADGAVIAFDSYAALDAVDGNHRPDVYVLDRATNRMTLVSRTPSGATGRGSSRCPSVSGDGQRIAFESDAAELAPADAPATTRVFVFERNSGTVRLVGTPFGAGPSTSARPVISADGRVVVFDAISLDAAPGERQRVYRTTLETGGVEDLGTGHSATVSADGQVVAYLTTLNPGARQVIRIIGPEGIRHTGQPDGQAAEDVFAPALSADGLWIAYVSRLRPPRTGRSDAAGLRVYLERVGDGVRTMVSATAHGREANGHSRSPAIDATGSRVVFESTATNLGCASHSASSCHGDLNLLGDIFVWDRARATVTRVNVATRELLWLEGASSPAISADGAWIAFLSRQPVSDADGRDTYDLFITRY